MTLDDLKQSLQQQIEQSLADVTSKQSELRQAELNLAHLQGQLHALNMIQIKEPIYTNGIEEESHA